MAYIVMVVAVAGRHCIIENVSWLYGKDRCRVEHTLGTGDVFLQGRGTSRDDEEERGGESEEGVGELHDELLVVVGCWK